jgi:hypothetical protein
MHNDVLRLIYKGKWEDMYIVLLDCVYTTVVKH